MSTSNAYLRAVFVSRTSAYTARNSCWARIDGSHTIDTITRGYSRNGLAFGPCVRSTLAISSLLTISNSRPNFSRISSCHFSARLGGQTMTTDQSTPEWFQLVSLDVRAAAERRLERVPVRRGDRAPADGVDKGGRRIRVVEAIGADRPGKALGTHIGHGPGGAPDADDLPLFR
jgi:hypothetical protein